MKKLSISFLMLAFCLAGAVLSASAQNVRYWRGDDGRHRSVYRDYRVRRVTRVVTYPRYNDYEYDGYTSPRYSRSRSYYPRYESNYYPSYYSYDPYYYGGNSRYRSYRSYPRRSGFSLGISIGSGRWW
ncbi:MAG: hypothetical protein WKF34_10890 [Pyrinomonadaceae bacterium]